MTVIRTSCLICRICWMLLVSYRRPCQAAATSSGAAGHIALLGSAGCQLSRTRQTQACSHRQEVAQAVLDYVAEGSQTEERAIYSQRGLAGTVNKALQPAQTIAATAAVHTSRTWANSTIQDLQLHRYIHHLPVVVAPAAWWKLCDIIHSKGLAGLQSGLEVQQKHLPDVQGAAAAHCQLGRSPWAYIFRNPALSVFVASLFHSIVTGRAAAAKHLKAPAPQLDRFDLFHGHIFTAYQCIVTVSSVAKQSTNRSSSTASCQRQLRMQHSRFLVDGTLQEPLHAASTGESSSICGCHVGILFHAAEYPAYDEAMFAVNLGHCQANSSCRYNQRAMDLRNILWWQGQLAVLDVGADSPLHDLLLHEGTEPLRTLYEEDFGKPVADVLLLQQPRRRRRQLAAEQLRLRQLYASISAAGQNRKLITATQGQDLGVYVSY